MVENKIEEQKKLWRKYVAVNILHVKSQDFFFWPPEVWCRKIGRVDFCPLSFHSKSFEGLSRPHVCFTSSSQPLLRKPFGLSGSRVGVVVRALASHQCVPGSIPGPGVICGLSLLLVLYSAPRGFSPGTPVFPSPQKPTFPNSNSILECTGISERVL